MIKDEKRLLEELQMVKKKKLDIVASKKYEFAAQLRDTEKELLKQLKELTNRDHGS